MTARCIDGFLLELSSRFDRKFGSGRTRCISLMISPRNHGLPRMSESHIEHCTICAEREANLEAVAKKTGMPASTVKWISGALGFLGRYMRKGSVDHHADAAELCRMLVADIGERRAPALSLRLDSLGIRSSRDIGRVIHAMVEAGLCVQSERDGESDFASIFDTDDIGAYLKQSGLDELRDWPQLLKSVLVWIFYIGGSGLLVARYEGGLIGMPVGIAGALIFLGWVISITPYPRPMRFGRPWSSLALRTPGMQDHV
jgi:uncharacterized repeat protein (TIGR04138 family)